MLLALAKARPAARLRCAGLLYAAALLAQPLVSLLFWSVTWDDSAITLGFARTLALSGTIAPTPGTPVVEGYSTTLWMLLAAGVTALDPDPAHLLVAAKLATTLLTMAAIALTRRVAARLLPDDWAQLTAGLLGLQAITFHETLNGMEGPLALVLLLLCALGWRREDRPGRALFLTSGALFVLTRWEAAWLLAPFVLASLASPPRRRTWAPVLLWGAVFLAANLVRWGYFGTWLPNTITAKMGEPYRSTGAMREIARHLLPLRDLALLMAPTLVALGAAALLEGRVVAWLRRPDGWGREPDRLLCGLLALFGLVLVLAIGANWGPPNRSAFVVLPFLLTLALAGLRGLVVAGPSPGRWLPEALAVVTLAIAVRHGAALAAPQAPDYMTDVTVAKVAEIVPVLTRIGAAEGRPRLVFAGPDMGGVILFGRHLRIVDLGKLLDPTLAREGYAALCPYLFERVRPDVIEIHSIWTSVTGIARCAALFTDYGVVFVDGIRLFVRRDRIALMPAASLRPGRFDPDGDSAAYDRRRMLSRHQSPEDLALNRRFGRYLVLGPAG